MCEGSSTIYFIFRSYGTFAYSCVGCYQYFVPNGTFRRRFGVKVLATWTKIVVTNVSAWADGAFSLFV